MASSTMAGEVEDTEKFYADAEVYWKGVAPTLDGMLGGFEKISPTDINGSKAFLRSFLKVGNGKTTPHRALDCGSGIGRITKRLLLPIFKTVDMVEMNQQFLDAARGFIGEPASRVERLICSGLQDFTPEAGRYNLVWCQWVLGHLTDTDLVEFFARIRTGLTPDGVIIIKENVTATENLHFDTDDSSFTRPREVLKDLIQQSGLTILKEEKQKGFPKGLYDVYMFALQ